MQPRQQPGGRVALLIVRAIEHGAVNERKDGDDVSIVLECERIVAGSHRGERLGNLGRRVRRELVGPRELIQRAPLGADADDDWPRLTDCLDYPGLDAAA